MPFRPRSGSSISSSGAPSPDVANFAADLNPNSLEVLTGAMLEPAAAASNADEPMQFERQGYFRPRPRFRARQAGLRPHRRAARHLCEDARAGRRYKRACSSAPRGHRSVTEPRAAPGARVEQDERDTSRGKCAGVPRCRARRPWPRRLRWRGARSRAPRSATPSKRSSPSAPASNGSPSLSASGASSISLCRASRSLAALLGAALVARRRRPRSATGAARRGGSPRSLAVCSRRRRRGEAPRRRCSHAGRSSASHVAELSGRVVDAREPRRAAAAHRARPRPHPTSARAGAMPERVRVTLAESYGLPPLGATRRAAARG